jgi:acyl-CoA synthetase (AMP-forming)/AMP-acid ligase II/NAD(P)-dependent dehydrogenase (short-subunit alcohol dehydrogenase family)
MRKSLRSRSLGRNGRLFEHCAHSQRRRDTTSVSAVSDQQEPKDLLPRPLRLLVGATGPGVSDSRLRDAAGGKVVLITGASSGVGRATARRLGSAGATVLLVARRDEVLDEVRDEIVAGGGSAFVHPCDMGDPDRAGALAADVLAQHGRVDVVVSNAGVSIRRWISQSYDRFDDVERTINVNYLGPVRLLLGLLPSMRERGSGHIVNVGTVGVDYPPLRWSAYIASKAAFETWLGGVGPEVRADGVSTTSIRLQLVRSPMLGPFRMWNYLPGMSTEEAAAIVARAIVARPRVIAPIWSRIGGPFNQLLQRPLETALARHARNANRDTRQRDPRPHQPNVAARSARLASEAAGAMTTIAASRALRPVRPDRLARVALAQRRFAGTAAFAAAAGAELYRNRRAVIDELGTLTFAELDSHARSLAGALHGHFDLVAGRRVAIMCRNHRGFVYGQVSAARLGCDLVPLNTDFAGPQLREVLAREGVTTAIYDQEFEPVFDGAEFDGTRVIAWHEDDPGRPTLEALISVGADEAPTPSSPGRTIMMTSGTTGTPKGAVRTLRASALLPLALSGFLELARFKPTPRSGGPIVVSPPLFHLYGQIGLFAGFGLGSPIVIRRRFDPQATLEQIDEHRAEVLLAVPTMLKRIIDLPQSTWDRYDKSSLRMIVSGAAPLPPELALAVMDQFGDILYNGYASTEVGPGTLATPSDLRTAPGTVGKPAPGVRVKILDEEGLELGDGQTGRIFVGNPMLFEGYTGGGSKEVIDGLMATGDVGHVDPEGRLFIDGRDDDMILSGGENVFPQEVEELLSAHDAVADAAVFGVPDRDFGQRLAASLVLKPDRSASVDELQAYVRERLARHKVPREIEFVHELPRTSTGKLRRRTLGAQRERFPSGERP